MVNNGGYILHKICYKRGKKHDYNIYKENHPVIPKQVITVLNLGYLDIEKNFQDQLLSLPLQKEKKPMFITDEKKIYKYSF